MHTKRNPEAHIQPRGSFRITHHFTPGRASREPQLCYPLSKTRTASVGPMVRHTDQQTWADKPKSKQDPENRHPLGIVQGQDTDAKES